MKHAIIASLSIILLLSCSGGHQPSDETKVVREDLVQVTATGNNNDGTVNIEYMKKGEFYQMFHISIDSLLSFIRHEKYIRTSPAK